MGNRKSIQKHRAVLITDRVHHRLIEGLEQHYRVDYHPKMSRAEVLDVIAMYEGVVINTKVFVDEDLLSRARELRWIGRLGSGLDIIDFDAVERYGVAVMNSPEGNAPAVGEHVLAMLLALQRRILLGHEMVVGMKDWDRHAVRGKTIDGQRFGILGFGHTGQAVARRLRGFDVELLVHDKYVDDLPVVHPYQHVVGLDELRASADIVSIHVPLTPETRGMIDEVWLSKFKGHTFINAARGSIVKTSKLLAWLLEDKFRHACLDVFENEVPSSHSRSERNNMLKLFDTGRVICTPHVAGWTHKSLYDIADVLLCKVLKFIAMSPES